MNAIKASLKKIVPINSGFKLKYFYTTIIYFGSKFICPCCGGHFRKFLPYGEPVRANAVCPRCRCLERHRLIWLFLKNKTNFFITNLRVLHFAPINFFQQKFQLLHDPNYISADLASNSVTIKMDITSIPFKDECFDRILCSHVLEHVTNDQKAMEELYRVIKPSGWVIIQVPINQSKTVEDPTIISAKSRKKVFGHPYHVRKYGSDFKNRLKNAGFIVKVSPYPKELGENAIRRYGLDPTENIYFCVKSEN